VNKVDDADWIDEKYLKERSVDRCDLEEETFQGNLVSEILKVQKVSWL
jgi:hypothetical protein